MRVAVTVDLEGDYGTEALRGVDEALPVLLEGFARCGVRATFFTVASVARARPEAVRAVVAAGHTVGSHTVTHRPLSQLSRDERRAELCDSRALLEDVAGAPCESFRAPFFDAPRDLGPQLAEAGYRWSSSKAPFSPVAHYRHLRDCARPHRWEGGVLELPVPAMLGLPIPEGLSYRRLFWPAPRLARTPPSVFYLHPYELLDRVDDFGYGAATRWMYTLRGGRWARDYLWGLLADWRARGAEFSPPDARETGAGG